MLTAAGTVKDRVDGLGLGADDYPAKPFDFSELVARVRALARRANRATPPTLCRGKLSLDPSRRVAARAGRRLELSPKEFAVLECLLAAGERVVATEELMDRVWDEAADQFTTTVKTTIRRLRAKLGDPTDHPHRTRGRLPDRRTLMNRGRLLTSVFRSGRPVLRVQLTVLYSGLFLGLIAAVLFAASVLYQDSAGRAPNGAPAAPAGGSHSFDVGPALIGLAAAVLAVAGAWWLAGRFVRPLRPIAAGQRTLLQVALAAPDANADTLRAACEEALQLGGQQEQLIEALLTLATSERGVERGEPFDLAEITDTVLASPQYDADRRGIDIESTRDPAPAVDDPQLVASLVANRIDNALRHNVDGGHVTIATTSTPEHAITAISNTGLVVPGQDLKRLFQPFQQTGGDRIRRDGHGLGLAIALAIAEAHGARLTARPRPAGGLDFEVSFRKPAMA
jgi:signal transduction histidine kinase